MPIAAAPLDQRRIASTIAELDNAFVYVVGIAIFRRSPDPPSVTQVLVVKRTENETSYPGCWEIPGGHVEPGETLRQAAEREAFEETGLTVEGILGEFDDLRWDSKSGRQHNIQYNYAATVKEPAVVIVNPDEHSEWTWAAEADVDGLEMTSGMKKVLKDAFEFARLYIET